MPYGVCPPVHPGVLMIQAGTARIPAETAARAHAESLHVFYEVRGIEQALIQQIVAAIDLSVSYCFQKPSDKAIHWKCPPDSPVSPPDLW